MIKATTITYKLSLEEMQRMLAKELNLNPNEIEVKYTIGTAFYKGSYDDNSYPIVTGVTINVNPKD